MLLCPNPGIASKWASWDAAKAYQPASGLDGGKVEAQRFHEHLRKAAVEFERLYVERAALSTALQNLERLLDAAPGIHSLHPPLGADSIPRAPTVVVPAPTGGPRTAEGVDCDPNGHSHGQGLGRELADSSTLAHGLVGIPAHGLAGIPANEHGNGRGLGQERGEKHAQGPEDGCVLDQPFVEVHLECFHQQLGESTSSGGRQETCDPSEHTPATQSKPLKRVRTLKPADFIYKLVSASVRDQAVTDWRSSRSEPTLERPGTACRLSCRAAFSPIVKSPYFDGLTCGAIVLNAIFMAFQMQYDGMIVGCSLDFVGYAETKPEDVWPWAPTIFTVLDLCFTSFFCLELLLRVGVYRCEFFKTLSNWLDITIVGFGLASSMLPIGNLTVARLMRLSKLSRMKRLKMNEWMESMRFLLTAIMKSNKMMILSFGLLVVVQCIVGMLMNSLLLVYFQNSDQDLEARLEVYYYYGTYARTMITLFEVHLANWSPACRVLVDNVGMPWGIAFVAYRCVVGFSLLNVISAVFIQTTMKAAQNSMELKIASTQKEKHHYAAEVLSFFQKLDTSADGFVTWEELQQAEDNEHYRMWLRALEIDPHDLRAVFDVLDVNGDNLVAPQELIINADRIKGNAKSLDVVHILANMKILEAKLDRLGPAVAA